MTTLAVTGATGFIGRELLTATQAAGWGVVPVLRSDFRSDRLGARLQGCDAVVHLAARAHVLRARAAGDDAEFQRVNVQLTWDVAEAAVRAGVGRFVFVSSAGVLGRVSPPPGFDDSSEPAPHDAYTRSKLAAEEMLVGEFSGSLEIVVVRPPLVYGPGAPGNFDRLVKLVRRGWPLPLGALRAPRSMVGLRNLCDLLCLAAVHPAAVGARMLVADAETRCVTDLIRDIAVLLGRPAHLLAVPQSVLGAAMRVVGRGADFDRLAAPFVVVAQVATRELGWTPSHRQVDELAWALAAPEVQANS